MKYVFSFLILFNITVTSIAAQPQVVLDVFPVKQNQTKWCWAASAEMIDQFHKKGSSAPVSQCDIVKSYYMLTSGALPSAFTCNTNNYCRFTSPTMGNIMMPLYTPADFLGVNYHSILLNLGYYSTVDKKLSFQNIKDEILQCKPIILGIKYKGTADITTTTATSTTTVSGNMTGNHIVVIKGFDESIPIDSMLMINDPDSCSTCNIKLINLRALKATACVDTINFFLAGIRQKKRSPCEQCDDYIKNPFLVPPTQNVTFRSVSLVPTDTFDVGTYKALTERLKKQESITFSVSYVDFNLLFNPLKFKSKLNSILIQKETKEVYYYNHSNYVFTKHLLDGQEIVSQVKKCRYPTKFVIYPKHAKGDSILIDLVKDKSIVFEIVRFPGPLYYEFYKFTTGAGKTYFVPANDYSHLQLKGKPLQAFQDYAECKLICLIKKEIKQTDKLQNELLASLQNKQKNFQVTPTKK